MQPTDAELASINASISFIESLDSRVGAVHAQADRSAHNDSTIESLGSDVTGLRDAANELTSKGVIDEGNAARIVEPVASAFTAVEATTGGPTAVLESYVSRLDAARSHCSQEDIRVREARREAAGAAASLKKERDHEKELPARLDAEIRDVRNRAEKARQADPRDEELERAAKNAHDELPRADRALQSAESQLDQTAIHVERAMSDVNDSIRELERARRQGHDTARVERLSQQLAEHQRKANQAEEARAASIRGFQDARGALGQALAQSESAREAADSARDRNRRRLAEEAANLDREADDLVASRQSKLDAARDQRVQAERRLAEAEVQREERIAEACRSRRDATRRAGRRRNLQAIRDIAAEGAGLKQQLISACDQVTSSSQALAASAGGLAALASGKSANNSDVASAEDADLVELRQSIRSLLRDRRRGYQRIWYIALPVALVAYFALYFAGADWAPAVFLVPAVLHVVHWLRWRRQLSGLKSIAARCDRIRARVQEISGFCDSLLNDSATSAFDDLGVQAARLSALEPPN